MTPRSSTVLLLCCALLACGPQPRVPRGPGSAPPGNEAKSSGPSFCPSRSAVVEIPLVSCREANRLAIQTVKRLGFRIVEARKAEPGSPGAIVGENSGEKSSARVEVRCSEKGAVLEATSRESCTRQLSFPSRFREAYDAVVSARRASAAREKESRPQSGLLIDLRPVRNGREEWASLGLMAVRLEVENRTDRSYVFDPARVSFYPEAGSRVRPLSVEEVSRKLGTEKAAVTTGALRKSRIPPAGRLEGYLFVPRFAYRKVRLMLEDEESGESEGYTKSF
ncbi:MAG: hypothetical protein KatS3mg076_3167 [Candidatus Binatia bacterium]|nr:MAG: hypothetical protein KatS3mg076_3167 [Candidatus Binatia bacterium]